jgi:ATP phosphoribosyltransferase
VLDEIDCYETVLIQNHEARHAAVADRIVRRLEGVVIARGYSLLEYNILRAKLADAEKITPGFNSPTVNTLEEPGWCAVRAMVRRSEVISVMEQLEALGASAILETQISNGRL